VDTGTAVLFALVAIIGVNQVAVRTRLARDRSAVFWGLTLMDLLAGIAVLVLGLPGFEHVPAVTWVVGLLLVMHVAQNLMLRNGWEQEAREEAKAARDEERKRRRQDREARELAEAEAEAADPP
jgi:hypothetical protein